MDFGQLMGALKSMEALAELIVWPCGPLIPPKLDVPTKTTQITPPHICDLTIEACLPDTTCLLEHLGVPSLSRLCVCGRRT